MAHRNLLKMMDLSEAEIMEILDLADQLKYDLKHHQPHRLLEGKSLAMIFARPSTRTRTSFEVGMFQLGGHALSIEKSFSQIGRGEAVEDTARALSRYCDGIMIRTSRHEEVERLAEDATVPVINSMTSYAHPCQILADLMSVRERKAVLRGLHGCFIGDGANVCNSLIVGAMKVGMTLTVACPEGYEPTQEALDFAAQFGDSFRLVRDPKEAAVGADVVWTDVWTSMGKEEEQAQRMHDFCGYQVNEELMALTHEGCMVLHSLPAMKGQEITAETFEAHADEIFEETENRLHTQKAILALLMRG